MVEVKKINMDIFSSLAVLGLMGLVHASFQLSVGAFTLMSGHAIGAKKSQAKLFRLSAAYIFGMGVMSLLLLSLSVLICIHLFSHGIPLLAWAIGSAIALGIGIAVWLFYYRRQKKGTELWIPRAFASHLTQRSTATRHSVEAFSLGLTTVIAELIFIIPSLILGAFTVLQLPGMWQLAGVGLYTIISLLGVGITWVLVGSGHSMSRIQKWREKNKTFLQFSAGSALIVIGFFVYVNQVVAAMPGAL